MATRRGRRSNQGIQTRRNIGGDHSGRGGDSQNSPADFAYSDCGQATSSFHRWNVTSLAPGVPESVGPGPLDNRRGTAKFPPGSTEGDAAGWQVSGLIS